jgi:hypothetical protein
MNDWAASFKAERVAAGQAGEKQINDLLGELFAKIYERKPTEQEVKENIALIAFGMQLSLGSKFFSFLIGYFLFQFISN